MSFISTNPATGLKINQYPTWDTNKINEVLDMAWSAYSNWSILNYSQRAHFMRNLAQEFRQNRDQYAKLITEEMGKLIKESRAEVEKCAVGCEYYAEHAEQFLRDEIIASDAGKSFVAYQPIGIVLAIMPWNFPFWQLIRAAAPAMMAGNCLVLKHASNVQACAAAIEQAFEKAGFPANAFRNLAISSSQTEAVISDRRVAAITLTGSCEAGRKVGALAGQYLKKCVLELGGSDPFIVLDDANLDFAAQQAVVGRFQNAGQSCIAAKRFIVLDSVADKFTSKFKELVSNLKPGDPTSDSTTLAPMARHDLRDELHEQVTRSIRQGAKPIIGCQPLDGPGAYYAASILDNVTPGNAAFDEELFGPVASIVRARDEQHAVELANLSVFGLGGSVWTRDNARGESIARQLHCGCAFVNGIVKSDPRLPFGGVKDSGYGRELSYHGLREFVNTKTVWIR